MLKLKSSLKASFDFNSSKFFNVDFDIDLEKYDPSDYKRNNKDRRKSTVHENLNKGVKGGIHRKIR